MTFRALCVAAGLGVAASVAACGGEGGSDGELSAPPVSPAPTSTAAADRAITTAAAPTTAAATTTTPVEPAPTTQATSTTTPAATLTPELEAELIDVYTNARRVLYEALLDPAKADLDAVARYWTPEAVPGWVDLLEEWTTKQWRFEPGPGDRYYAEVSAVELGTPTAATLSACVVSDAAVFDGTNGSYIDPGYLSSYQHHVQLRLVDGRWLVHSDDMAAEFRDVAACGA